MTSSAPGQGWAAAVAPPPLLPPDRVVLAAVVPAHLGALVALAVRWPDYRSPWAAVALLASSAALPLAAVNRARPPGGAGGRWPRGTVPAVVVGGLLAVSVGLLADLPTACWASWAAWNWGVGAVSLSVLAIRLRPGASLTLAAGHGVLVAGAVLLGGGGVPQLRFAVVCATVPLLGTASYLHLHGDALRRRGVAASARMEAEAGRRSDVLGVTDDRRLAVLLGQVEPLLRAVADGAPLPLDAGRTALARRAAEQLREALAAQRRALWLPAEAGGAPVRVVAADTATRAVGEDERSWLAALVELLGAHPGWEQVRVVLDRRLDGAVTAVVTADGAAARRACADPRLRALCAARSARCDADGGLLVVEADFMNKIGA